MIKLTPPFTLETARQKVRKAEDAWNGQDPDRVVLAYSEDTVWRNRSEFFAGREAVRQFLIMKWQKELEYRLIKSLWAFDRDRIAVRFAYEWRTSDNRWFRSYGNEVWAFNREGLMTRREASINDVSLRESERRFHWPLGPRPDHHPELEALGL